MMRRNAGLTGDFNVVRAHKPAQDCPDVSRPLTVLGNLPGGHPDECAAFERLLQRGPDEDRPRRPGKLLVDVWRLLHGPTKREYTYVRRHL